MTISIGAISQQIAAHKATPTFQHFAFFIFTTNKNSIQFNLIQINQKTTKDKTTTLQKYHQ